MADLIHIHQHRLKEDARRAGHCQWHNRRRSTTFRPRDLGWRSGFGVLLVVLVASFGCHATSPNGDVSVSYAFSQGAQGWTAGAADYPPDAESFVNFTADARPLPPSLGSSGLFMSSRNVSGDVFMYYAGKAGGFVPGATYSATFAVQIASNAGEGCAGVGGQPGEAVTVKAGAASVQPLAVQDASGWLRMNIDKGSAGDGANAAVLGNIAVGDGCGENSAWRRKQLTSAPDAISVQAASDGSVWLFAGTDSAFEGKTSIYITQFDASFSRQ
jgi:hypothetical protein